MPSVINGAVFLTVSEIAERWNVSISSVLRTYVQAGRLRATRIGRVQVVSVEDLAACEAEMIAQLESRIENLAKPYPSNPDAAAVPARRPRDPQRSSSHVRGIRRARTA